MVREASSSTVKTHRRALVMGIAFIEIDTESNLQSVNFRLFSLSMQDGILHFGFLSVFGSV